MPSPHTWVQDNTASLMGPGGPIGRYRKAHIPPLGVDRFVRRGASEAPVFETAIGRIGVAICYELRFPESARALALQHNNGHRQKSARALGIGVRTLGLKLKKWKDMQLVAETL